MEDDVEDGHEDCFVGDSEEGAEDEGGGGGRGGGAGGGPSPQKKKEKRIKRRAAAATTAIGKKMKMVKLEVKWGCLATNLDG